MIVYVIFKKTTKEGGKSNTVEIKQKHDVPNWSTLLNAVYPTILEIKPDRLRFIVSKVKGNKYV